jgi:hypothetical protein
MQFGILLVGLMVFVFYQFHPPPVFWNNAELDRLRSGPHAAELVELEAAHARAFDARKERVLALIQAPTGDQATVHQQLRESQSRIDQIRTEVKSLIGRADPHAETKDADYIFIRFVTEQFPPGLVGLLLAVILCAAMSASASALNALGSTSVVDFYRRSFRPNEEDAHYLRAAKLFTVFWGVLAVLFAGFASLIDNLIQAVNILGSIFYGPMLGVFTVGFVLRRIGGRAVFWAVILAQLLVIVVFFATSIGFLWYNVIGCFAVVLLSLLLSIWSRNTEAPPST